MVYRFLFGFKIWQMVLASLAVIIAGGWALLKLFELFDESLNIAEDNK